MGLRARIDNPGRESNTSHSWQETDTVMDRLTGLRIFARTAALGSFSAAGRALALSPAMATKHVDALERRLGVRLFHRTTRRVAPTEAGRRYLKSVERILAELDEADAVAAAERVEVSGLLRVNAPVSFGVREVGPRLPSSARATPVCGSTSASRTASWTSPRRAGTWRFASGASPTRT